MSVIRRDKPAIGILWSEMHFDGKGDDAGRLVLALDPKTLIKHTPAATFAHAAQVRIAVGIHPAKNEIVILLASNDSASQVRQVYVIPKVPDGSAPHNL